MVALTGIRTTDLLTLHYTQKYLFCSLIHFIIHVLHRIHSDGPTATRVPIDVRFGRVDCPAGPDDRSDVSNRDKFPNPRLGLAPTLEWCRVTFGFTTRECVAIIGKRGICFATSFRYVCSFFKPTLHCHW